MTQVMIVYASLTGNTRAGAQIVAEAFKELGTNVNLIESYDADPYDFEDADICVDRRKGWATRRTNQIIKNWWIIP